MLDTGTLQWGYKLFTDVTHELPSMGFISVAIFGKPTVAAPAGLDIKLRWSIKHNGWGIFYRYRVVVV